MNRESYLKDVWVPFPEAPAGSLNVADYLAISELDPNKTFFVCGRLAEGWTLNSEGHSVALSFIAPELASIFRAGDLVAVELGAGRKVSAALLLVPAKHTYHLDSAFTPARSLAWNQFIATVREFFTSRLFIEARTPTLVPSPGTEPYLDPFKTDWKFGSRTTEFYLPTSPEFHLKKMLVAGWTRIFEMKPCFRNGEISEHHQPEFLMLEWYRAYSNLDAIADDVSALIDEVVKLRPQLQVPRLKRTTVSGLFEKAFPGFTLQPQTTVAELSRLAKAYKISVADDDSFDDVFFRLFLEKIEPSLGVDGPLLVRGYPPSQAALSRIGADGFADRFEVYWHGLELANAFHELNDPAENEARFREDAERKKEIGKRAVPVDEKLIEALYAGMPPSGGIALGLERLFMALFGIQQINDVRAFPIVVD